MRRREFLAGLGAAAWPLTARAQQIPLPEIGFLSTQSPTPMPESFPAFRLGPAETGFSEGRNVGIEYRWADQAECERFEVRYSWQKATLLSVSCHISCPG